MKWIPGRSCPKGIDGFMGKITLICGALHSDRTERIDALWKDHGDRAVLLTPTPRLAWLRQEAYVRTNQLPGLWGSRAWELGAFAKALLEQSGIPVRMISRLERRMIVRGVLEHLRADNFQPCYDITSGLVKHLVQIITQLKQAGVDPACFRRAVMSGGEAEENDPLVVAVYDGYQEALLKGGLYDVPGLYWAAEDCCKEGHVSVPCGASVVLLDGFDDFTPSQQRFLLSLSHHVSRLVIGLNSDVDPDRADLFHLQWRWTEYFQKQADVEVLTCQTHTPVTAVQYAAGGIFGRNIRSIPESLTPNLRIVPCADAQHELEFIGRSVKSLITGQQVAPASIAVGLTDMAESAAMVRSIFDGFGIPCTFREGTPLLFTPPAAVLMRVFDLIGKWETRDLVALITSPLLHTPPEQRRAVMVFPLIARETGVVMGHAAWKEALEELQGCRAASPGCPSPAITPEALALFRQRVELFAAFESRLPENAVLEAYAGWCDALIGALGMEKAVEAEEKNLAAVAALRGLLQSLAEGVPADAPVSFADFVVMLREGMEETTLPPDGPAGGAVVCTDMDGLRCENFSHIFLGGLNEGMLPRSAPRNVLYTELDLPRLRGKGVDLAGRREHTYRERLLFYHALCAAQKTLVLTWRKQDKQGRESLPSPYVTEIADLFAGSRTIMDEEPGPDCFVPGIAHIASPRDLANAVFYGKITAAETDFPEILGPVRRLAAIEEERNGPAPFGRYDGVIQAPDLLAWLGEKFGAGAQFSTDALESYIAFPFQFFLRRVLRVPETAEAEGELDSLRRGALLHEVLQRFHQRYSGQAVPELLARDDAEARQFMDDTVEQVFISNGRDLKHIPVPLIRVEKQRFVQALQRYLNREAQRPTGLNPSHFEVAFGRAPRKSGDALSSKEAFLLDIDGEAVPLSGIIDRIDLSGDRVSIIDYKTASFPEKADIKYGLSLQLTLYAWAVERYLLPRRTVESAHYLPVFRGKPREALFLDKAQDAGSREETALNRIKEAVAGIRNGYFPPLPDAHYDPKKHSLPPAARFEAWRIQRKFPERNVIEETGD